MSQVQYLLADHDTGRRSVHSAYLAMPCNKVVSKGGASRGLGFDGVNGEAVGYELNQCRPIAGHQHLIWSQPQRQLCFLQQTHTNSALGKVSNLHSFAQALNCSFIDVSSQRHELSGFFVQPRLAVSTQAKMFCAILYNSKAGNLNHFPRSGAHLDKFVLQL